MPEQAHISKAKADLPGGALRQKLLVFSPSGELDCCLHTHHAVLSPTTNPKIKIKNVSHSKIKTKQAILQTFKIWLGIRLLFVQNSSLCVQDTMEKGVTRAGM